MAFSRPVFLGGLLLNSRHSTPSLQHSRFEPYGIGRGPVATILLGKVGDYQFVVRIGHQGVPEICNVRGHHQLLRFLSLCSKAEFEDGSELYT